MGSTGNARIIKDHAHLQHESHDTGTNSNNAQIRGDEQVPILTRRMTEIPVQMRRGASDSATEHDIPYVRQRIGSAELAKLVPIQHHHLGDEDEKFFSGSDGEASHGLVHLLDFDRREDAPINFNELSAMHTSMGLASADDESATSLFDMVETQRHRDTETQRHRDRDRQRQAETDTERQTQKDRQTESLFDRWCLVRV